MKQLGNLALVCAKRSSTLLQIQDGMVSVYVGSGLQIQDGMVSVYVGSGPERNVLTARWDNDAEIERIIRELNFGMYQNKG